MTLERHSAPGQALGYYFQLERALAWVAKSDAGNSIGIETEDDIVVNLSNGSKILEQDKSSVTGFPFNPLNPDLWKSLLIWLDAIKGGEIVLSNTLFYLVTNQSLKGSLVEELGRADSEIELTACVKKLRTENQTSNEQTLKYKNKVLAFSDDELKSLIKKIRYSDHTENFGDGLKTKLISDLQLENDENSIPIIEELTGWVFHHVVKAWRERRPALIERDSLIRVKSNAIRQRKDVIINEEVISIGSLSQEQTAEQKEALFVKQLEIIKCNNDEIIEAIKDYLNCIVKRTDLSKKGIITEPQLKKMDEELIKRWDTISKRLFIQNKKDNHTSEDLGKLILLDSLDHNAKIGSFQTSNYFFTRGSYHLLADGLYVGWHPEYKKYFILKEVEANE